MARYHYIRKFRSISDSKMLTEAQTMRDMFVEHIADFEARYPDLNLDFANYLQELINIAKADTRDKYVLAKIGQLNDDMKAQWTACTDVFNDFRYHIERAFPENKEMWKQFGYDKYRDMTRSHTGVVLFMDLLHGALEKHKTELMAVGVQQAQIDNVLVVKNEFLAAQKAQQSFLKTRPELTQTRVTKLNNVWMTLKRINKASKSVYRKSYEGLQMFLMPAAVSNEMGSLTVTGVVFNRETSEPIPDAKVEIPELKLETKTDENGRFGFAKNLPKRDATLRVSAQGFGAKQQPIKTLKAKKQVFEIGLNSSSPSPAEPETD